MIDGIAYAMAGASKNHQKILGNLFAKLHAHLENTPCTVFSSDLKLKVNRDFFYPDLLVVCDDPGEQDYYTEAPLIIVEVLSKTTRKTDKTLKRHAYQSSASLQEYVLIEQDFVDVEVCRRSTHWQSEHYYLGDTVQLAALELAVTVEALYARVQNEDMQAWLAEAQHPKTVAE
jgi:Uma2 family endonuclease